MSITSAQSYEMRIARSGDKMTDPPEPIGKPSNGYWQIEEAIMSRVFSPTRYVILIKCKAKREFA